MISKATIIFEDEEGILRFDGFLIDQVHAMYVEPENGDLYMVKVVPIGANSYKTNSGHTILGHVSKGMEEQTINELIRTLKEKTAYDFLSSVVVNVDHEIDFSNLIIPGFIKNS